MNINICPVYRLEVNGDLKCKLQCLLHIIFASHRAELMISLLQILIKDKVKRKSLHLCTHNRHDSQSLEPAC